MRRSAFLIALLVAAAAPAATPAASLLPLPQTLRWGAGSLHLQEGAAVEAPADAADAVRLLEARFGKSGTGKPFVRLIREQGHGNEGYRLEADASEIRIGASTPTGHFRAAATLAQLANGRTIPAVSITDAPRFPWRGLMLDSARHPQSPAFIKALIDAMAMLKLNRLHWHLSDDQGWRIEIKAFPKLGEVGGCRSPAVAAGAPALPAVCRVYSQAEIRDIIAYAAARHIQVVPEIDMPGHALAAVRAYPELGMGVVPPVGIEAHWGVFPYLFNTKETTFAALETILGEVIALFPSREIHIGGDEALKDQWAASAETRARIASLGLKDPEALQGWFMARMARFLESRGRRAIGWDEILDSTVPAGAVVMSWRGPEGAAKAAKLGHDAILSPAPILYLDNMQRIAPDEPPGRGAEISLAAVYGFEPVAAELTPAERGHILGLQGNLWTEHVRTEARAAHMLFPRAAAIAERGWSSADVRDVQAFARRLAPIMPHFVELGLAPAASAFTVDVTARRDDAGASVSLGNQLGLPVHYTLDGSAATGASAIAVGPIAVSIGDRLRASSHPVDITAPGAIDIRIDAALFDSRRSQQLELCSRAIALNLEDDFPADGERASFLVDIVNPCWIWRAAPTKDRSRIALTVGQLPFNFQIGAERDRIRLPSTAGAGGAFEVRSGCDGPVLAMLSRAPAISNPGLTRLEAPLAPGATELCIRATAPGPDPLWVLYSVELLP